jgi:hypothetical protein
MRQKWDTRHSRVQAGCGVPTRAGHARQPFTKGSVEAFDTGRSENLSSPRRREQLLGPLHDPVKHAAGNLHDALFLGARDHCPTVQVWPHPHVRSPRSWRERDLLAKRLSNVARRGARAVCHHKEWAHTFPGATALAQSWIGQPLLLAQAHRSGLPASR